MKIISKMTSGMSFTYESLARLNIWRRGRITDSLRTLAPSRVKLADFRPVEEEKGKKRI
jgi:hypothetical protein